MAEVVDAAEGGLLALIGDIEACAVEPAYWPTLLENIAGSIGGCAAAITVQNPASNALRIEARWNTNTSSEHEMVANAPVSPALQAIWLQGADQAIAASRFFGDEAFRNTVWFEKVLKPADCCDVAMLPLAKSAEEFSSLLIMRRTNLGPYASEEIRAVRSLAPHFRRAASIAGLLHFRPLIEHCLHEAILPSPAGIILTDATGKIVHTNSTAERMLDGRVLLCVEDELSARDGASAAGLQAAIARAGKIRSSSPRNAASALLAKGPGAEDIAIWVLSIGGSFWSPLSLWPTARVAVLAHEIPEQAKSAISADWDQNLTTESPADEACFIPAARIR